MDILQMGVYAVPFCLLILLFLFAILVSFRVLLQNPLSNASIMPQ